MHLFGKLGIGIQPFAIYDFGLWTDHRGMIIWNDHDNPDAGAPSNFSAISNTATGGDSNLVFATAKGPAITVSGSEM